MNPNNNSQMEAARKVGATDFHFSQAGTFFKKMYEGNVAKITISEDGQDISIQEHAFTNTPMAAVRM